MQVVGVGFVVGVIQDSCETALNSSTDVLFTVVAERSAWKNRKKLGDQLFFFALLVKSLSFCDKIDLL